MRVTTLNDPFFSKTQKYQRVLLEINLRGSGFHLLPNSIIRLGLIGFDYILTVM